MPAAPDALRQIRVLVLAGVLVGVGVVGVGGRLAMLLLRVTSPDHVRGTTSDDGFVIGRFTLPGTYNLLMLGAAVGVVGAATYRCVRPWLLGPRWFRLVTVAAAAGAVGGSMLLHADGIDFTQLRPTWLAIALFVALPAALGGSLALAVERVERVEGSDDGTVTTAGWVVPTLLVAALPATVLVLVPIAAAVGAWSAIRYRSPIEHVRSNLAVGLIVRAAWLTIAVLGLIALVNDIGDIRAAT